jgi:hypothetical protein
MIRLLLLVAFLIPAYAQPAIASSHRCDEIPERSVRLAHEDFEEFDLRNLKTPNEYLRRHVLVCSEAMIERNFAYGESQNWDHRLLDLFREAIEWRKTLLKNPETVPDIVINYRKKIKTTEKRIDQLSKEIKSSNDIYKKLNRSALEILNGVLLHNIIIMLSFAEKHASTDQLYKLAVKYLFLKDKRNTGIFHIESIAEKDYPLAQLTIAQLYKEGRYLEQSDEKAYYWFLRAKQHNFNVDNDIKELGRKLSLATVSNIHQLLRLGISP